MDTRGDPSESLGRDRSAERYYLYQVFGFEKKPRLFILPGSLRHSVILDATNYRASLP